MQILTQFKAMQDAADAARRGGRRVGLVPTMGYFHEGHLSLMRAARKNADLVVVSSFVNPIQFGPREDFARYPRDDSRDRTLAAAEGVDLFFQPTAEEMYPPGYSTYVEVENLTTGLCGAFRPGHFRGVATVVTKLFLACKPHVAYFGRKDYQQAQVIKRMARDLNFEVAIETLPTVRENDGLAMSSRNSLLTAAERTQALALYRSLREAQRLFAAGERDAQRIRAAMAETITAVAGARLEYAEVVDGETLHPITVARAGDLAAVAAYVGTTRLIDNTLLGNDIL